MNIINIPAYSYFGSNSYRSDIYIITDFSLLKRLTQEYPSGGTIWNESGDNIIDPATQANKRVGVPIFNSTYRLYQVYNKSHNPNTGYINMLSSLANAKLDLIKINDSYDLPSTYRNVSADSSVPLNNTSLAALSFGNGNGAGVPAYYAFYNGFGSFAGSFYCTATVNTITATLTVPVLPDNFFNNEGLISREEFISADIKCYDIELTFTNRIRDGEIAECTSFRVRCSPRTLTQVWGSLNTCFGNFSLKNSGANTYTLDEENPYGIIGSSTTGGGDGKYGDPDSIVPTEFPALPTVSAADVGFCTIYNPSKSQLRELSGFMWSELFDLNSYKKLFADPMESIIGLAIVPVTPSQGGIKNVQFGTIDSGISMPYLSTQYVKKNCGSVSIDKYIGSFLDGAPYTKVSIFLPFIGIHELSADDVVGRSIEVEYNIDVLSGACSAFIYVSGRGVLYQYNGSCISNIPLTSINFSSAIQNAVSAVCSGAAIIAGMASGAAPLTAGGAMGLLNSAANTAINSKPSIQRSGSLGGSAGIMSTMTPYVIIERPDMSVPYNVQHYVGQVSNITMKLDSLSGFTMVDSIHLDNISATTEEINEIEALLKGGIIL